MSFARNELLLHTTTNLSEQRQPYLFITNLPPATNIANTITSVCYFKNVGKMQW